MGGRACLSVAGSLLSLAGIDLRSARPLGHVPDDRSHMRMNRFHMQRDLSHMRMDRFHMQRDLSHLRMNRFHMKRDSSHMRMNCFHMKRDSSHLRMNRFHLRKDHPHVRMVLPQMRDGLGHLNSGAPRPIFPRLQRSCRMGHSAADRGLHLAVAALWPSGWSTPARRRSRRRRRIGRGGAGRGDGPLNARASRAFVHARLAFIPENPTMAPCT